MNSETSLHWAVVGGGMLGMRLAERLAKSGQRVTLLEAAPQLGGLASEWQIGDVTWDRHYHVTLLSDSAVLDVLDTLGLKEDMVWTETKTGFFTDGKFYSMSSALEFLRFPPLNLWQKLRLGGTIFLASKIRNWKRLEQLTVSDWLIRWSGPTTYQKIWLPLLRAKLGELYKVTSAAFIWAYIARMYKARRTGLKREMFGYVRGGYARILREYVRYLEELGVTIQTNTKIQAVSSGDSDSNCVIHLADGRRQEFDRTVLTIPSSTILNVCPQLQEAEKQLFRNVKYLGIVCASVLLKRPLKGYYVTNITDPGIPLTGVIDMSSVVPPLDLNGHYLVYLPKYIDANDPLFDRSDDEIREMFLGGLRTMYPDLMDEQVTAFRISRVRNVMAVPTIDYSNQLPPIKTSLPGVFALNSAQIVEGTLNVNETIEIADEGFERWLTSDCSHSQQLDAVTALH